MTHHLPDDDRLRFHPEPPGPDPARMPCAPWRVLSADDDAGFQQALANTIAPMRILDRPLELVSVRSLSQAARLLARDRNFAVILVDVVMETDDAGLRLARSIREMLGLHEPRIVLLTGQPGFAPVDDVMEHYDLTDYCLKSDLGHRGLKAILTGAIRAYSQLAAVSAARRGLQQILESSRRFAGASNIGQLADTALQELAKLLEVPAEGIVCVANPPDHGLPDADPLIVGAAGQLSAFLRQPVDRLPDARLVALIRAVLAERRPMDGPNFQILYFPRQQAQSDYAVYLASGRALDDSERELLGVFAANAAKGFGNVALISRLDRMAFEDELLHIPNRGALLREIDTLRQGAASTPQHLVLIDLDNFAGLNDAFGVMLGDRILKALVGPLRQAFPAPALVARITSDLFGVVGPAESVDMDRAAAVFDEPVQVDQEHYRISACTMQIGLEAIEGGAAELLRAAWGTLHDAKRHGPGSRRAYDPHMERAAGARFELMSRLGQDIRRDALFLAYQPQVDLATGQLVGAEALLRWRSEGRFVPPGEFIPLAEQSSYIHDIGEIVLRHACGALGQLAGAGMASLLLSINLSARQFEDPHLVEHILAACAAAGIAPGRLGLEVTETVAMSNFNQVSRALGRYREAGNLVAIDDFGTGLSSLEYLYRLPADHLKIDRVFVSRLEHDLRSRQLAKLIIDLGHAIGAQLIAEGVETQAQADWLREHGCHIGQGWLFARPMPLEALIAQYGPAQTGSP
jgi:diguanylate cyclase (GGDEF)-like protein